MWLQQIWDHLFTLQGTLNKKEFLLRFLINLFVVIAILAAVSISVLFVTPYIEHIKIWNISAVIVLYGIIFLLIISLFIMNQLSLFVRYLRYLGYLKSI